LEERAIKCRRVIILLVGKESFRVYYEMVTDKNYIKEKYARMVGK
jgi:hypothetical protein